jgi:subtilisin family serine protease
VVGVIDTGIVLDADGRPPAWFGDHLSFDSDRDADELPSLVLSDEGQGADESLSLIPGVVRLVQSARGHGTFVAGLVLHEAPSARVRVSGVLGDSRDETVTVSGVLGDLPAGTLTEEDDIAVAEALRTLAQDPAVRVINLSFGGGAWAESRQPTYLAEAIAHVVRTRPDIALVAAAGNEGRTDPVWPAAFDGVLAVGVVDEHQPRESWDLPPVATFSNTGPWVDAYASGVALLGPLPQSGARDGWARWGGSSFAAAVVSGKIARLAIDGDRTGAKACEELIKHSDPLLDGVWVRGVDSPRES